MFEQFVNVLKYVNYSMGISALGFVLMPTLTFQVFDLMSYQMRNKESEIENLNTEAKHYIKFLTAVLGGVMFGWSVGLDYLIYRVAVYKEKEAYNAIIKSLFAWFIFDTAYSQVSGFYINVLLNIAVVVGYIVPLVFIRNDVK